MAKKVIKSQVDMKSLAEVLEVCKNMTVDNQYKAERSKNPAAKRAALNSISFWGSVTFYLRMVEVLTDDEVQQVESRIAAQKGGENG